MRAFTLAALIFNVTWFAVGIEIEADTTTKNAALKSTDNAYTDFEAVDEVTRDYEALDYGRSNPMYDGDSESESFDPWDPRYEDSDFEDAGLEDNDSWNDTPVPNTYEVVINNATYKERGHKTPFIQLYAELKVLNVTYEVEEEYNTTLRLFRARLKLRGPEDLDKLHRVTNIAFVGPDLPPAVDKGDNNSKEPNAENKYSGDEGHKGGPKTFVVEFNDATYQEEGYETPWNQTDTELREQGADWELIDKDDTPTLLHTVRLRVGGSADYEKLYNVTNVDSVYEFYLPGESESDWDREYGIAQDENVAPENPDVQNGHIEAESGGSNDTDMNGGESKGVESKTGGSGDGGDMLGSSSYYVLINDATYKKSGHKNALEQFYDDLKSRGIMYKLDKEFKGDAGSFGVLLTPTRPTDLNKLYNMENVEIGPAAHPHVVGPS